MTLTPDAMLKFLVLTLLFKLFLKLDPGKKAIVRLQKEETESIKTIAEIMGISNRSSLVAASSRSDFKKTRKSS